MTVRKCQTCKHFEQSPIWRKGWCRNPRLYSPQQSHLVGQDDLDCSRGLGDYWEPIEVEAPATPPSRPVAADATPAVQTASEPEPPRDAEPRERRRPLRFFSSPPRLAPAPAGMLASAAGGSGGGGTGGGSSAGRGGGPAGGNPLDQFNSEPPRPARSRMTPGQERAVSYQPEERYWTDYLRIALPVIGLLLMLGLFWFWASSLISNDDNGKGPTATPKGQVAVVRTVTAAPTSGSKPPVVVTTPQNAAPTPTPTQAAAQQQQQQQNQGQTGQTNQSQKPASTAGAGNTSGGTTATAAASSFANGAIVTTTDTVNMRDQPSINGNVVTPLDPGTQLTITGPPQKADGYTWYPVKDVNGDTGYVAGELLKASGQ